MCPGFFLPNAVDVNTKKLIVNTNVNTCYLRILLINSISSIKFSTDLTKAPKHLESESSCGNFNLFKETITNIL